MSSSDGATTSVPFLKVPLYNSILLTCAQYRCDVTYCNEGTNGLPLQTLFGFERVHVKAGETVQVYLYPALTELSVANLDGSRSPLEGDFVVRFGVVEAAESGMGFAKSTLSASFF